MKFLKDKNNKPEAEKKSVREQHWARFFFIFLAIVSLIGVGGVYKFAQKPAQGVIKSQDQTGQLAKKVAEGPEIFSGKYLSFRYGNTYVLKTHDIAKGDSAIILEQAYLSELSVISKKISLTVRSLPTHSLEDNPDYRMREMEAKRYHKKDFFEGKIKGIYFISAEESQFEKTFFIMHDNLLAIISVTAPSKMDASLDKEANNLVKSLIWKE